VSDSESRRGSPTSREPGPWDGAYRSASAPWDIGRPQPVFVTLADAGQIEGPVLDSGCGTGEHALLLAERGIDVLGVDFSPFAIRQAREKAARRRVNATFAVHDVLDLESLGRTFRSVIDSGVFHVFDDPADSARYVAALRSVIEPGGVLHLMCFSDAQPGSEGPRRVSEADLRAAFDEGWSIESIEPATFEVNPPMGNARAWLARIVRTDD